MTEPIGHEPVDVDPVTVAVVRAQVDALAADWLRDLDRWLRIRSISADPGHRADVAASAALLAELLTVAGFPVVEVWPTAGQPAVFAEWPAAEPGAPTVLVYGHHDVQPVDPESQWDTPPFEPTRVGDRLYGRGTADDKGQVLMHLLGLRAHLAATGRSTPGVTLKLVVEGEEESGSPHFAQLLRDHRDRLRCDVVVVSDTAMYDATTPSVCTGMRGMVDCQVDLHGPDVDLHSGAFGGAVPNPLHAMAVVLSRLHDAEGRVTLPGFYDDVRPLDARERELFAALPYEEGAFLATAESRATAGEQGYTTLERVWARPTAEVNGMWGGYTGPGHKTIIPSDAHAKISFRLVADQQPTRVLDALRAWLPAQVPHGITWSVAAVDEGVRPCLTPLDDPYLGAVTRAASAAFGTRVLYTREGGSGPQADLAEVLAAPVVFLGVGLPDDRIHAPNEKVEVPLLLTGATAAALLWQDLAANPPPRAS